MKFFTSDGRIQGSIIPVFLVEIHYLWAVRTLKNNRTQVRRKFIFVSPLYSVCLIIKKIYHFNWSINMCLSV